MSWWERIKSILTREARDLKEGFGRLGDTLDAELARKERELEATPEERIDMILDEQAVEDGRFDELSERILGEQSGDDHGEDDDGEPTEPDAD